MLIHIALIHARRYYVIYGTYVIRTHCPVSESTVKIQDTCILASLPNNRKTLFQNCFLYRLQGTHICYPRKSDIFAADFCVITIRGRGEGVKFYTSFKPRSVRIVQNDHPSFGLCSHRRNPVLVIAWQFPSSVYTRAVSIARST